MLLNTGTTLAMRCSSCGKLDFHHLSAFSLSGGKAAKISCSCGATKLILGTKKFKQYWLQIPCILCETNHLVYYTHKKLWSDEVSYLYCSDTNVELGFLGPEEKVKIIAESYESNLESLIDELGYDDYFHNPEIMFEVLNNLHDIAEAGYLYCQCGNYQIEVDIFPDRIELNCRDCDSISIIYAETEEDLQIIKEVEKIELAENGFKCLDSLSNTKKNKKNSPKRSKR